MGLLLALLSHGEAASWTMSLRSLTELRGKTFGGGCSKLTTFLATIISSAIVYGVARDTWERIMMSWFTVVVQNKVTMNQ